MYDIIFISYGEPNADKNWQTLKDRFPYAKRVDGVKGIHQAHIKAAKKSFTKMFWVVDGDSKILQTFNFDYEVHESNLNTVHIWWSKNPVNGLVYGYGGVKLLPNTLTKKLDLSKPDVATSISNEIKIISELASITEFNTDAFSAWRSGFRECTKLSSKVIDRQIDSETEHRLETWCNVGTNARFGIDAIKGAKAGRDYGQRNKNNAQALSRINDYDWLIDYFRSNNDIKV
jgi:hypothetical protein